MTPTPLPPIPDWAMRDAVRAGRDLGQGGTAIIWAAIFLVMIASLLFWRDRESG